MDAYRLQANHSITRHRARATRHSDAVIQLRCTLTVYLLILQPLVDVMLKNPFRTRRPRAISITNITSYSGTAGARTWHFTINLYTCNRKVRTHTWRGRQLPLEEIEELPLALLRQFEKVLNYAWYKETKNRAALNVGAGVLLMSS